MLELYGHLFSSFTWKALIACYERDVPFVFRAVEPEHPENLARIAELSPAGQFPALVDDGREIIESNAVVEYLDLHHGTAAPLVPADPREALGVRMMADVFDDYVHLPMQRIVAEAFRGPDEKDPCGVRQAHARLERSYGWLESRVPEEGWTAGARFTLADCAAAPALFYADWVHAIAPDHRRLRAYRARLLAHPSVARAVEGARPYRSFFPLGAPDRD